ncbi:MAG: thiosulfate oxidation carrier protein SoxY [Pseudomonadota bacterium]
MELTRRDALLIGAGAAAAAALPLPALAAEQAAMDEAIAAFTGGAAVTEGGVEIGAPEIAENGNTVPIEVGAAGAASILILADGNPNPGVATFNFGKLATASTASTRIRLAKTQNIVAVAKLEDGSFVKGSRTVKVTIGGCGG